MNYQTLERHIGHQLTVQYIDSIPDKAGLDLYCLDCRETLQRASSPYDPLGPATSHPFNPFPKSSTPGGLSKPKKEHR
jgi:hypothetical protein